MELTYQMVKEATRGQLYDLVKDAAKGMTFVNESQEKGIEDIINFKEKFMRNKIVEMRKIVYDVFDIVPLEDEEDLKPIPNAAKEEQARPKDKVRPKGKAAREKSKLHLFPEVIDLPEIKKKLTRLEFSTAQDVVDLYRRKIPIYFADYWTKEHIKTFQYYERLFRPAKLDSFPNNLDVSRAIFVTKDNNINDVLFYVVSVYTQAGSSFRAKDMMQKKDDVFYENNFEFMIYTEQGSQLAPEKPQEQSKEQSTEQPAVQPKEQPAPPKPRRRKPTLTEQPAAQIEIETKTETEAK